MTTQDTYVYHCLICGRIEHRESAAATLHCCGKAMSTTCTETHTAPDKDVTVNSPKDLPPLVDEGRKKNS